MIKDRIKYRKDKYINIINKVINNKIKIIEKIALKYSCFYFNSNFIINKIAGIFFDINKCEICCYNKSSNWEISYVEDF
jgi:hypothetical protein